MKNKKAKFEAEEIDINQLMRDKFPKQVVSAYRKKVEADIAFNEACKNHAPEPPFKKGDKILLVEESTLKTIKRGVVQIVRYAPYSSEVKIGAWVVKFRETDQFFNLSTASDYIRLSSSDNVLLLKED